MPGDVQLELARHEDSKAIIELHVVSWRSAYRGIVSDQFLNAEIEPIAQAFRREMECDPTGQRRAWVARSGDNVIAFADTGPCRDPGVAADHAELFTLHVAPNERGRGVGRGILARAVDDLKARGWRLVTAWVLQESWNARRFYETCGWKWDGETLTEQIGSAKFHEVRYALVL